MSILSILRKKQESGSHKFYAAVRDEQVLEDVYEPEVIQKNRAYFKISLSEMFLKSKTNYISGFIPMTIAVNSFNYNGQRCEIPVMVGNKLLNSIEKYVRDEHIEFRNSPIIGPVPYTGADVGLFVGLYRLEVDNLAKSLFKLMERIISTFDLANLSGYLNIADKVGDGLADLIGMKNIQMQFGTMDTFGGEAGSHNQFRSGYLVFINCPENDINPAKIWVRNGRLLEGPDSENVDFYSSHDFCLVRIKQTDSRPDLDTLPFHMHFKDSKSKIWEGNMPEAERLFLSLIRDMAQSPDLTPDDKTNLMKTYYANYQQEKENYAEISGLTRGAGDSKTRGLYGGKKSKAAGSGKSLSARATIQRIASMADRFSSRDEDHTAVQQSFEKLASDWETIPHLAKNREPLILTPEKLNQQFEAVKASQREIDTDPKVLADILTCAAFSG